MGFPGFEMTLAFPERRNFSKSKRDGELMLLPCQNRHSLMFSAFYWTHLFGKDNFHINLPSALSYKESTDKRIFLKCLSSLTQLLLKLFLWLFLIQKSKFRFVDFSSGFLTVPCPMSSVSASGAPSSCLSCLSLLTRCLLESSSVNLN